MLEHAHHPITAPFRYLGKAMKTFAENEGYRELFLDRRRKLNVIGEDLEALVFGKENPAR